MNAAAIDYIWKVILESERSDELQFMDDEMLSAAAARGSAQSQPDQSGAVSREPIAEAAIGLKLVDSHSLQADSHVGSWRPHRAASSE